MSETSKILIIGAVGFVIANAVSYWMATLGNPNAVWFWHDMLGLL